MLFMNMRSILRRLRTSKRSYAMINILGLAVGLTCCILILIWVADELSYDRYHPHAEDIHRILIEDHFADGNLNRYGVTPGPLAGALISEYPEVLSAVRLRPLRRMIVRHGDISFMETEVAFADPSLFQMFQFEFLSGTPGEALRSPDSMVITESVRHKYFGRTDPVGKVLMVDNRIDLKVSAVVADPPRNTHLNFVMFIHFDTLEELGWKIDSWDSFGIYTYLKLRPGESREAFGEKIKDYLKRRNPDTITRLRLQSLVEMRLYSTAIAGFGGGGNILYIYIFSSLALFVLIIACVNFMNLSTAQAGKRALEVGIRKVVGASREHLVGQFMGESLLYTFLAFGLALLSVRFLLPSFSNLAGKSLAFNLIGRNGLILWFSGIAVVTGLASGIYPALILSSFSPIRVFKGDLSVRRGGAGLRTILVVFQFGVAVVLIIGTLVVYKQLSFMRDRDLGYDNDHLLYLSLQGHNPEQVESLKQEILSHSGILTAAAASDIPTQIRMTSHGAVWEGKAPEQMVETSLMYGDYEFLETMGIEMSLGRFFSRKFPSDAQGAFVLNEAAVRAMGLDSPLEKWFEFGTRGRIIGVIKDFHTASLRQAISPLVIMLSPERYQYLLFRIQSSNISSVLDFVQTKWTEAVPEFPLEYGFIDDRIDSLYRSERRVGSICKVFAVLAVFISCLGILGLASFMAEQRTREIGIRKVLGASVNSVVLLLSGDFLKWVLLANLLAWPAAFYIMNVWLNNFAYRTTIGIGTFFTALLVTLAVSLMPVIGHSLRAAVRNPSEILRY